MPHKTKSTRKPSRSEIAAAAIAARIELARRFLHDFVKQAWHVLEPEESFVDNWHIKAICEHLQAMADPKDDRVKNLLINVPPGTMKSLLVCVFWPAWVWTTRPAKRFMYSSYSEELAMRDSLKCRQLLASQWYQARFPLKFSDSQDTKGKFENENRGWRMIGSITGKGLGEHPDFFAADDPNNVTRMESDKERFKVSNWIESVFGVRGMIRDVRRVLVMQRLHANDASGKVLEKGGFTHICLPMRYVPDITIQDGKTVFKPIMCHTPLAWKDPRYEPGELLWPAKYPAAKVDELEMRLGLYHASGQLQQSPSPRGGGKFKRVWFVIKAAIPATILKRVRYWDKAGTKGPDAARTATVLMFQFKDETAVMKAAQIKWMIMDAKAYSVQAAEREAIIKQTAQTDSAKYGHIENWVEQEPGSGGLESAEGTISNLVGFTCKAEKVTGSKEVRCDPFASQASVGNVWLLEGEWNQDFLDEVEMFPLGKRKDLVDAGGGAFNKLVAVGGSFGPGDAALALGAAGAQTGRQFTPRTFTPRRY